MYNFGKIKNIFNDILAEGVLTKDKGKHDLFKKYLKTIKENKVLSTQYLIYNEIENLSTKDPLFISEFIKECSNKIISLGFDNLMLANKKLINLSDEVSKKINESETNNSVDELFGKIIENKNKISKIKENLEIVKKISNLIIENYKESVDDDGNSFVPNSLLSSLLVDKFNQKYRDLSESDRKIIKKLQNSNDTEKLNLYNEIKNDCLKKINENLIDSDIELKEKLLLVKEKLLEEININENFINNLIKLIDLKENLYNE